MSYVIDKNVPIPKALRPGRPMKYPFKQMDVGDSFGFEEAEREKIGKSADRFAKNHSAKFIFRGNRVWRKA